MNLPHVVQQRLKDGNWAFKRGDGKHEVWVHGNGNQISIPRSIRDFPRKKANYFAKIARLERAAAFEFTTPPSPAPPPEKHMIPPPSPRKFAPNDGPQRRPHGDGPEPEPEPASEPMAFRDYFRKIRRENGLTPMALAELFQGEGVNSFNNVTISNIEADSRGISPLEVEVFKRIFSITEIPSNVEVRLIDPSRRNTGHRKAGAHPQPQVKAATANAAPAPQAPRDTPIPPAPAPAGRQRLLAEAMTLIENARITDAEAEALVAGMRKATIDILLGGLA